jgi:hypothetical protein
MSNRSLRIFIHILDDDLLLKILRSVLLNDAEADSVQILQGRKWDHHRGYTIAHVCRRWRYLVLSSASYLGLCLACTYDTSVAYMLAHSPPLPIIMDWGDEGRKVNVEKVKDILVSPWCRRRVRRIRLRMSTSNLRTLFVVICSEFARLEYLHIKSLTNDNDDLFVFATFKTPHLRDLPQGDTTYFPSMLHLPPPATHLQSAEEVVQCAQGCGAQIWRYAPFYHVYWLVSERDLRRTEH